MSASRPDPQRQAIESALQNRDLPHAKRLILQFLKTCRNSLEARYEASEYYRRISEFPSALRVLRIEPDARSWSKLTEVQLRHQLQSARILNLLGASARALKTLTHLPEKTKQRFWMQTGGILASNFRSAEALPYFQHLENLPERELDYRERLQSVTLADCLFGAGKSAQARSVLERILALSQEPLLLGIAHQALGAYSILEGDLKTGARHLEISDRSFPRTDTTLDRGFLEKWLGALRALQGDPSEAREHLNKAWKLLYRPGTKPEAWLEVLYWIGFCDFREKPRDVPLPWARLLAYPSPGQRMVPRVLDHLKSRDVLLLGPSRLISTPATTHYDPSADVSAVLTKSGLGYRLGMSDPERLAAALVDCGPHGLPQYRAYDLLWPEEPFSFSQHQKRIEQLVLRNRKAGFPLEWKDSHLTWSDPKADVSVRWRRNPSARGSPFLEAHPGPFTRKDVEIFFSSSRTVASELIKHWLAAGHCESQGSGKTLSYHQVVPTAFSRN